MKKKHKKEVDFPESRMFQMTPISFHQKGLWGLKMSSEILGYVLSLGKDELFWFDDYSNRWKRQIPGLMEVGWVFTTSGHILFSRSSDDLWMPLHRNEVERSVVYYDCTDYRMFLENVEVMVDLVKDRFGMENSLTAYRRPWEPLENEYHKKKKENNMTGGLTKKIQTSKRDYSVDPLDGDEVRFAPKNTQDVYETINPFGYAVKWLDSNDNHYGWRVFTTDTDRILTQKSPYSTLEFARKAIAMDFNTKWKNNREAEEKLRAELTAKQARASKATMEMDLWRIKTEHARAED